METVSDEVQIEPPVEVAEEPVAPATEPPVEVPEPPVEQVIEQSVEATSSLEPPTPAPKRVRKVRVRAPTDTAPQHTPPDPNYWRSRLEEHRANQRTAKNERYGNLRIM
jgi:hypothetical protein